MSKTSGKGNQGIIVSGGSLQANDIVVGENATVNKISQENKGSDSTIQDLRDEVNILISVMEQQKIGLEKIDAVRTVKKELEIEDPNMQIVKPVLGSIIESIKAIGSIAGTALSVKKALDLIL